MLAAGGISLTDAGYLTLASAELYDTSTGKWTAAEAMTDARDFFQMLLLPNGKGGHGISPFRTYKCVNA